MVTLFLPSGTQTNFDQQNPNDVPANNQYRGVYAEFQRAAATLLNRIAANHFKAFNKHVAW